jgi:hypothetical protein
MLLGDLLVSLHDSLVAERTLASLDDLVLATRVTEKAIAAGVPLGIFAAEKVDDYASTADDEEWTTVIGLMARSDDPGAVLLKRALSHCSDNGGKGCTCSGSHA